MSAVQNQPWWAGPAHQASAQFGGYGVAAYCHPAQPIPGAPNVFLVHGMVDSSDTWTPLLPALEGCNVWLLDLPWSGRDGLSWPTARLSLDWFKAALAMCSEQRGIFIGHSFGATVLLDWLASEPTAADAVDGMVLLAPFYCGAGRSMSWDEIDSFARGVDARFQDGLRARAQHKLEPALLAAMAGKLVQRVLPDGMLEMFRIFLRSRSWPMGAVQAPLMAIVGQDEAELARTSAADLADACPQMAIHLLPECGHYSMHEQPAAVRDLVAGFIASITHSQDEEITP